MGLDAAYDPDDPCAGCGVCCDPVWLRPDMVQEAMKPDAVDPFYAEHLHFREVDDGYLLFDCDQY